MTDDSFKILNAGEGGVDKTSLPHKFVSGTFMVDTGMTIDVQFHLNRACGWGSVHAAPQGLWGER